MFVDAAFCAPTTGVRRSVCLVYHSCQEHAHVQAYRSVSHEHFVIRSSLDLSLMSRSVLSGRRKRSSSSKQEPPRLSRQQEIADLHCWPHVESRVTLGALLLFSVALGSRSVHSLASTTVQDTSLHLSVMSVTLNSLRFMNTIYTVQQAYISH